MMSSLIYFNGLFISEQEALLPIKDRSYLYGEGLFETLKATRGLFPFLKEHLERFFQGLEILNIPFSMSFEELEFALQQTLRHNRLQDAYVRMNLSRLNQQLGDFTPAQDYHLVILAKPIQSTSTTSAAAVLYSEDRVYPSPLRRVKSMNYLTMLRAKAFARQQNAQEALLLNHEGRLVEGATSNLFFWNGHGWKTPNLEEGALPGVTRHVLLELMERFHIPYEQGGVSLNEFEQAQEAILTNAMWELQPLTVWQGRPVGTGAIGEATQRLQGLFQEEVQRRLEKFQSQNLK